MTAQDVAILERADELLNAPARWNPSSVGRCPTDPAAPVGLDCALERAARDVTGRPASDSAALEYLRYEVGMASSKTRIGQRLRAWNNTVGRTFAEVKSLLARGLARARGAIAP